MIFLLSGLKGFNLLKSLDKSLIPSISSIIYDIDKKVENDYSKEILDLSLKLGIKAKPWDKSLVTSLKVELVSKDIYCIAIGWRKLINGIEGRLIVLHDSLLPRYRGFAPTVTQLVAGENEIGVTAFWASHGYDEGDIIKMCKTNVDYPCKIRDVFDDISACYKKCVEYIMTLDKSIKEISFTQQKSLGKPSYSLWRDEYDYFIDWDDSAAEIVRLTGAVSDPYDGAQFLMEGKRYILDQASVYSHEIKIEGKRQPGKIFDLTTSGPLIVTGEGLIIAESILRYNDKSKVSIKSLRKRLYRPTYHEFITFF